MSLKNVHLLFITACLVLGLFLSQWAVAEFRRTGESASLAWLTIGVLTTAAMAVYGWRFQRRCRRLGL